MYRIEIILLTLIYQVFRNNEYSKKIQIAAVISEVTRHYFQKLVCYLYYFSGNYVAQNSIK